MSTEDLIPSRPLSAAGSHIDQQATGPYAPSRPTLPDVLANSAPPPWTLSAFTAYLSQNHCLENLEFTMDADRYRERFDAMKFRKSNASEVEDCQYLRMLWQRLLDAYIIPDGSREINIPSNVRETLLSLPNDTIPPRPEELDDAITIIYNLMEESVLVSFLNDVPPSRGSHSPKEKTSIVRSDSRAVRQSSSKRKVTRSRSRRRPSPASSTDTFTYHNPSRPPPSTTSSLTVISNKGYRSTNHFSNGSGDASMTDDSSTSSPPKEPMTPPNTPPSSDIGGTSPKQRSDTAWKKMLVWKKKSNNGMRDARIARVDE